MAGSYPPHLELILADPAPVAGLPAGIVTAPQPQPRKRERRQSPRAKAAYPRKRANQACRTCRVRRTKCDNERPSCSSCTAMAIPCIYQSGDPSTFDPASLAILARIDGLEDHLRTITTLVEVRPAHHTPSSNDVPHASSSALKELQSPALERTAESVRRYINIEAVLSWPIFDDQGFDESLNLRALLQANANNSTEAPVISVSSDFELYAGNELFRQFLDHVHIFNPVLEEAKVNEYIRHARFNGLGWDAQSCLLLLIYAIGSISIPFEKTPPATSSVFRQSSQFQQAESFFFAAQKRMGMLLCGSTVIEAQCFFLAGVYLMATLRPFEAWKMFIQALACCQGFYSPPHSSDNELPEERHLQESVYWTCFKSELELRLELNISERGAWDLTYPTFFPSPPEGLRSQREAVWYFYLAEIALRRLGNRILNYVYQDSSSTTSQPHIEQVVANFEDQADGWLQSLPLQLKLDRTTTNTHDPQNSQNATLKFILNGHLLDCYEMMYWPFVVDAIQNRLPPGTSAKVFARKGLTVCVQRIQQNEAGFCHRHHGAWLMLRSCTRSAFVLVAAARCAAQLTLGQGMLPEGWQRGLWKVVGMLRFWRDESAEVEDRLRILERLMDGLGLGVHGRDLNGMRAESFI